MSTVIHPTAIVSPPGRHQMASSAPKVPLARGRQTIPSK